MGNIVVNVMVSLALIISLMPIIAWYAGLFGIACLAYLWLKARKNQDNQNIKQSIREVMNFKYSHKALYMILFGIFIHGSCRIHSQLLINKLYDEAVHEKNIILTNVQNENNK
jgi:hypothetical protein